MAISALISMNARCLIHAEVKDQDVSIPQDPSDVFVSRDIEVNDPLLFKLQEKKIIDNQIILNIEDNNSCVDVDECQLNSCSVTENSICINSPGGYQCICKKGHVMYKEGL